MRDRTRIAAAVLIGVIVPILAIVSQGDAGHSDEFNYYMEIELENTGSSDITGAFRIPIAASALIDGGYIQDDAEDCDMTYLGADEYLTAMDLSATTADWRTENLTIPPNTTVKKVMYFGNALGTRNQSWIGAEGDTNTVVNPGSFSFSGTESFTIMANVTPAANPTARQYIFQTSNSYELTLDPGPIYRWHTIGDGAPTATATLSATVGTMASLIAWHNGPGGEIVLCDSEAGACARNGFSDLQMGGTPVVVAECDCVIDELAVRTPYFPIRPGTLPGASGTPPAWAQITGSSYECSVSGCNFAVYDKCFDTYNPGDWVPYFTCLDSSEPVLGSGYTHRYGFSTNYGHSWPDVSRPSKWFFHTLSGSATTYYSDDQVLSGISLEADLELLFPEPENAVLMFYTQSSDGNRPFNQIIAGTATMQIVRTGTLTVDPLGRNWTMGRLKETYFSLKISSGDPFSCSDCWNNPDGYIHDMIVRFTVAD